ncbi:SDR family oxidoreductase [Mucilaginibacter jinjuensis]|uniref:SDR family NAD(P)-dependent oxidoreductase n=1 Tax=Mucilaginibacter jinjuensis TaxID=1176721 RepID=A0ABY7T4I5_9SPHI|nr:SDR family oxidoreductase [Mucilaginibacter jinjuensis]WCT11370.1 SDR family NAD(P)-dependent oxidoreductase [Mucilaginibacter jinjuensis]
MKNALITGATKGMGRAIAFAFAKQGLNLAICSRNIKDLEQIKAELQSINQQISIVTVQADASKKEQLLNFAQKAEAELGQIHVIVNNVGIYQPTSIMDDAEDTFDVLMNANLRPAYELYRYFGKKLAAAKDGHIFNICSIAAITPVIEAGTYTVTKAATLSLSNIMRLEMQQYGVKVTSVIPGSTLTSSWDGMAVDANKMVLPEDIASGVIAIYNMSAGANVNEITITPVFGQI